LIPKNRGENFFSGFLHLEFFATLLIVTMSLGYSDINKVSSMVTNHDRISFGLRRKNSKICPDNWYC
jgi:hypothetical protein